MKRVASAVIAAAFGLALGPSDAKAAPVYAPVPTDNYITFMDVDWAWAAPCAPSEPTCGAIDLSFQGPLGWKVPTIAEMTAAVTAAGGSAGWAALFGTSSNFKCASAWFSVAHTHCDYNDAVAGYIHNYFGMDATSTEETFVMRGDIAPIPVPAGILLLVSGLAGLGLAGRRSRASA